ncbi:hypothetical protein FQN57_005166 [Myotisia sp. PD_48]|nr:hypothetical protein FQN57_005166 [Myotisia sp. PD_48]
MSSNFKDALQKIDEAHSEDPTLITIMINGTQEEEKVPNELHYANKMTSYLFQHESSPSELLQLAIRAQHLRRWELPRSEYPMTRGGYLAWRIAQKKRHAQLVQEICLECGYSSDDAARVGALVRKENMKNDAECQVLEDVACLVFLAEQFEKFEQDYGADREKMVNILKKTWAKMSERGHSLALKISMSERLTSLVVEAVS